MPTYTIFAGVNGCGKTSIYQSFYYEENKSEKRINTDEMVARVGSWKDSSLQLRCAREAVKLIKEYLNNDISFNQETTLCGKSIIRNIKTAKEKGFYVVIHYIGVDNPDIAKARVRHRVSKGGHGISDEINIYDNTEIFKEIIDFEKGKLIWKDIVIPNWAKDII